MSLFLGGEFQGLDDNGDPLAGGKVYFYVAGTTTLKDTYTDSTLATPNTNPVILDANGRAAIWLSGGYKVKLTDSSDVQIYEEDGVNGIRQGDSAIIYPSGSQVVASGSPVAVAFGAEDHDDISCHDNVTNNTRITIPSGSNIEKVRITAQVSFTDVNTTGFRALVIRKNADASKQYGMSVFQGVGASADCRYLVSTPVFNVTEGDYFELYFWHSATVNISVQPPSSSDFSRTWMSIEVVR